MLRGFTTVNYWADDVEAARDWYVQVLGIEPYFERPEEGPPAYVEFRVGPDEDELGLIDRRYAPPGASGNPGGAIMHWQVDDVSSAVDQLVELGATGYQPVTKREAGFCHSLSCGSVRQHSWAHVQPTFHRDARTSVKPPAG